jgi:trimeric autotransporter adhesin
MHRTVLPLLVAGALLLTAHAATAQSATLLELRAGNPPGDRLVVDSAGGFVARGAFGHGIIPATGGGVRLMWYPRKAAFRTGWAVDAEWDDASVGPASTGLGEATAARGYASTALGSYTTASGNYSTAMGQGTTASGSYSTAMGERTTASGSYSTAMGVRARAGHAGSFVWSSSTAGEGLPADSLVSSAIGQFSLRAVGGIRMFTNESMTSGMILGAGSSTPSAVSDRHRKENFAALDGEDVLLRLRQVPVTSWNYIAEGAHVRHVGPMAQDWYAAFRLNDDSLTINLGDLDGINLAAIQALDERTRWVPELTAEVEALRREAAAREDRMAELERRLEELETRPRSPPPPDEIRRHGDAP